MDNKDIQHKLRLIEIHERVIKDLLVRLDYFGKNAPPHFNLDLEDRVEKVKRLNKQLQKKPSLTIKDAMHYLGQDEDLEPELQKSTIILPNIDKNEVLLLQSVQNEISQAEHSEAFQKLKDWMENKKNQSVKESITSLEGRYNLAEKNFTEGLIDHKERGKTILQVSSGLMKLVDQILNKYEGS